MHPHLRFPKKTTRLLPLLALILLTVLTVSEEPQSRTVSANDAPAVTAGPVIVSIPANGGTYGEGEAIVVAMTFSEAVTVTGDVRVRLIVGERKRWARYDHSRQDGAVQVFAYKIKKVDADQDGISIGANKLLLRGGSIEDADGNDAVLDHPALSAQSGHKVDGSLRGSHAQRQQQQSTNTAPSFDGGETASRNVPENSPGGTNVGAALAVTNTENDTLTFALSGSDAFTIDGSGQIKVASGASLDHETMPSYSVTVTVHDGKNAAGEADADVDDTIAVTITVTDLEEAVPDSGDDTPPNSQPQIQQPPAVSSGPMGPPQPQVVPSNSPVIPRDDVGQPLYGPGRSFRVLFLTSGKREALSSDIDDYNRFVQVHAAKNPDLAPYSSEFRAIASTASVNAIDNTDAKGGGYRIHWYGGQLAGYSSWDLWDGRWGIQPCRVWDEQGNQITEDTVAWTGGSSYRYSPLGSKYGGSVGDAGTSKTVTGCYPFAIFPDTRENRARDGNEMHRLYAISPLFTVGHNPVGLKLSDRAVEEHGGTSRITATLATASSSDVTVRISATPVSPAASSDFTLSGSRDLVIRAGRHESENALTIAAVDNNVDAAQKFIEISGVITPAVAGLSDPTSVRLTILDDEVPAPSGHTIPADSTFIPVDDQNQPLFTSGQSFRLLFITGDVPSQAGNRTPSARAHNIDWYDALVQDDVDYGRIATMRQYSGDFRALVCTKTVDGRDNTATTYTEQNMGVPIYWLKGSKVADDYAEFYGAAGWESWDPRSRGGKNLHKNDGATTGCNADGTAHETRYVGTKKMAIGGGYFGKEMPIGAVDKWAYAIDIESGRFYGLSPVFTVE